MTRLIHSEFSALLKHPIATIRPVTHIFLLSHMRAYTSLFGHILGSNPSIEGYYEMHLGYFSWRSLLRQKMLYHKEHGVKPGARYIFDKILHNDHPIASSLFARKDIVALISIREPIPTISSMVDQYRRVSPEHQFTDLNNAARYYIERLASLALLAETIPGKYVFIDAKALVNQTESTLALLSEFLNLNVPLASTYSTMKNTAQGNTGDHSENIKSGSVQGAPRRDYKYSETEFSRGNELEEIYQSTRSRLLENASRNILVE